MSYRANRWKNFITSYKYKYVYSQKWREDGWIDKQVKKGRMLQVYANTIKMFTPILDSIHPGNWDLQFDLSIEWQTIENMYKPVYFNERTHNRYIDYHGGFEEGSEQRFEEWLHNNPRRYRDYIIVTYEEITSEICVYAPKVLLNRMSIIIRYPELTIRNSRQQSLQIKDLFIKLSFDENGKMLIGLEGTRSTYTLEEFASNYTHSHLPKKTLSVYEDNRMRYDEFCLGTGEIKDFISVYNAEPSVGNFESVIYMMNTVASWESLEGTPYASLAHTLAKQLKVPNVALSNCQRVFQNALITSKRIGKFDIDWVYKEDKYVIVENEKFEEFLRLAYLGLNITNIAPDVITYIDETGTYYVPTGVTRTAAAIHDSDFIPFQGQKVMLKVEGDLKFAGERQWYINPKIKQYVKSKLECALSKTQIRNDTITRLNQVSDNRRVPEHS